MDDDLPTEFDLIVVGTGNSNKNSFFCYRLLECMIHQWSFVAIFL